MFNEIKNCIFCEIATKKAKSFTFWEDNDFMAFLSIYPNTPGVSVVIPKKHQCSNVLFLPRKNFIPLIVAAQKVSKILSKLHGVGRVALVIEGFGVNHAHIKLFPMHGTHMHKWSPIKSKINTTFKKYEGFISSHDGPRESDVVLQKMQETLSLISAK